MYRVTHVLHRVPLLFGVLLVAPLGGCSKDGLIPNTHVKDTAENRALLKVVEGYRQAMENHDLASVLGKVHPTYLDNAGTSEGSDDIDFSKFKELLRGRFQRAKQIRYRVEYQDVRVQGVEAEVDVYLDATFVYEPETGAPRWRRLSDYSRFRLIKDGGDWKFVSGL